MILSFQNMGIKDRILQFPTFYKLVQQVLAGPLVKQVHDMLDASNVTSDVHCRVLDVGCGPGQYAKWYKGNYTGVDLSEDYIQAALRNMREKEFFVADACDFNLPNKDFDAAVSIGLYHHLSDEQVKRSIACVLGHLRKSGKYYVFDAVLPRSFFANPLGYILRKNDRGRYVRHADYYKEMLEGFGFNIEACLIGRAGLLDYISYIITN